ncbi:hypothetical protein NKL07_22075 [Mesorhizobium sp. C280B]|uniref:hypothetical protein n=1 Tax=unclassified Mesorhizobium TaxID=325217 RepID=UPI0003CF497E|nr:hypothetical protein [Mesorhizobium sp. LSJC280B00]ESW92960.1 hypothetical protein X772_03175 [Mesorhizobium sp. LSJC280B00]
MTEIHAEVIDTFQRGTVRVMCVTEPGHTEVIGKEGNVKIPYKAGDVVLVGADDRLICGPIGFEGAIEFAEKILSGNTRAMTQPAGLQMLATVIIALSSLTPQPPATVEQAAAHG